MLTERLIGRMRAGGLARLVIGSVIASLAVSLGMLAFAGLLGVELGAALPAASGAIAGALFAARLRLKSG
ncbi:MAG: hypothetical protein PVF05_11435 [Gemmatimonadales bacterium]|jgi:hypothetical protein